MSPPDLRGPLRVFPSELSGRVRPPRSKSLAHRRLFCLYLATLQASAEAAGRAERVFLSALAALRAPEEAEASEDLLATAEVLERLWRGGEDLRLDCRESGSTLRFVLPVAALSPGRKTLSGQGRLPLRPLADFEAALAEGGVRLRYADPSGEAFLPLTLEGRLRSGDFHLPGRVSSQYLTGLLLALPCVAGESRLWLSSPLESAPYVALTLAEMERFGVRADFDAGRGTFGAYVLAGGQSYMLPERLPEVEADASQAAFFHLANYLGAAIEIEGPPPDSRQGDAVFPLLLERLKRGAAEPFALAQYPDIVPAFALACAATPGRHRLTELARLRYKECDRLEATRQMLCALGLAVECGEDWLALRGLERPLGRRPSGRPIWFRQTEAPLRSFGDHRMAMAQAIAAAFSEEGLRVDDAGCVRKSYPAFWRDFAALRGSFSPSD